MLRFGGVISLSPCLSVVIGITLPRESPERPRSQGRGGQQQQQHHHIHAKLQIMSCRSHTPATLVLLTWLVDNLLY